MIPPCTPKWIQDRLARADTVWLFLDYDGTLADFEISPEHVRPDAKLIALIGDLVQRPRTSVAVVSGRRLRHIQALVPVPGVLLAGTYGIELQMPSGERIDRLAYAAVRPMLDAIKPDWEQLIAGRQGFFLEDKGWALALHARFADDAEAVTVLRIGRRLASDIARANPFRVLGGHKFLEIGPKLAHKGRTVAYLLDRHAAGDSLPLYIGDDDKDEEAFEEIKARDGIAILVASEPRETIADCRLASPQATREWLMAL
jgi:trehalose-phosphatase